MLHENCATVWLLRGTKGIISQDLLNIASQIFRFVSSHEVWFVVIDEEI